MHKATMVAGIVASMVLIGGTATAAKLVTSGDIKDGTISSKDIKNKTITSKDIKQKSIKLDRLDQATQNRINAPGPAGPKGAPGVPGPPGPPGPAAATDFGVASVFVDRGAAGGPSRFATYSVPLGAPTGSTVGGQFRFSCSPAQAPCKVSIGAAVVSTDAGTVAFYPRLTLHKESGAVAGGPITFCEYVDGSDNNLGVQLINRAPTLADALTATKTALDMGVGSSLDCGSTQVLPANGVVTEIDVPAATPTDTAFYDVFVTFAFGGVPLPDVPDTP